MEQSVLLTQVIDSLAPLGAKWTVTGNTTDDVWFEKESDKPSESEIQAEMERLQAEYDSNEYQRDRQYPPIGEQLDMIYHAGQGGDKFQTTIKAIKDAHPKPE